MNQTLHVLLLEDRDADAELTLHELRREGLAYRVTRARNEEEFTAGLLQSDLDIILADYALPSFDGLAALDLARSQRPQVPFIFVTGALGEEKAIEALQRGATDYVLKRRLVRLGPAVLRAQREVAAQQRRQQAERELRESQVLLQRVIDLVPHHIFAKDIHGRFLFANAASARSCGKQPAEMVGMNEMDVRTDHDHALKFLADDREVIRSGRQKFIAEEFVEHPDGQVRCLQTTKIPFLPPGSEEAAVLGVAVDITELRKAQQELQESEARFREMAACIEDVLYAVDGRHGEFQYVSPAFERMLGYTLEDVVNMGGREAFLSQVIQDGGTDSQVQVFRDLQAGQAATPRQWEAWWRCKDGTLKYLEDRWIPAYVEGCLNFTYGVLRDITARHRAEEAQRESDAQLRSLGDNIPGGALYQLLAPLGGPPRFTFMSAGIECIFGIPATQVLADPQAFWALIVEEDAGRVTEAQTRSMQDLSLFDCEFRQRTSTGDVRWVHARSTPRRLADGSMLWDGVVSDITERKRAEQRFRETEHRYRRLFEEATEGIALADAQSGELLDCNKAFQQMTGYDRAELLGQPQAMLHAGAGRPEGRTEAFMLHCGEGRGTTLLETFVTKSGNRRTIEIKADMMSLDGRDVLLGFFRDVTDELRTRDERETTLELLRLLNDHSDSRLLVRALVEFIHRRAGFEAVGIRLQKEEDFPYFETFGFGEGFVHVENHLCSYGADGQLRRDAAGQPLFACMCGAVVGGHSDPALPWFTPKGSFWTNGTSALLAAAAAAGQQLPTRNRCNREGYESVGLFALRYGAHTYGLLQLNDHACNRFTPELIAFLEHTADQIAMALAQRQAQDALRASEEHYRLLAENTEDFVALSDTQGNRLYVSPSYYRITGWDPADDATANWTDRLHPDDRPTIDRARAANLLGQQTTIEYRVGCRDGTWLWVEAHCKPICDRQGQVDRLLLWSHDITRRKQAEEELSRLATIVEQSAESIVITDPAGMIQYVNETFLGTTGYARQEVIGQYPRILKSGRHDAVFYRELWATLARGEVWKGHFINRRKDGALFEEDATISPIRSPAGTVVGYAAIKRDVTEHRLMHQQLLQAQKMETIGRLAGGVAHDFNNLLQAILGYNEILLASTPAEDGRRADLLEIQKTGQRAADLTRQLLALGRKQNLDRRVTDLNLLIEDLNKMLRRVLGEDIRIVFELAPKLDRVFADHGQIGQILLNLAINARDAMPHGGRLVFRTEMSTVTADGVAAEPDVRAGRYVCISVTDTGTGIPPEIRERLFEPFFTTKAPGKGTGLGLATSYGIARQHDGWMEVDSEPRQGACFRLYLPVLDSREGLPEEAPEIPGPPPELLRGNGERILFVEDEEIVRVMIRKYLEQHGYVVEAAADAASAIDQFLRAAGNFDLILTDVVLPDLNGLTLVEKLLARKPDLRILISSGYTDNAKRWPLILERQWPFIGKPYTFAELLTTLHSILARG